MWTSIASAALIPDSGTRTSGPAPTPSMTSPPGRSRSATACTAWTVADGGEDCHRGKTPRRRPRSSKIRFGIRPATPGEFRNPAAGYAFVVAGDSAITPPGRRPGFLTAGIPFRVSTAAFETGGENYGRGALLVFAAEAPDPAALRSGLDDLAATGARVLGVENPLTTSGPHLGSDQFVPVVPGRIAMVMSGPVRPSAYGSPWYLFERRFGLPFTALSWERLGVTDLRGYRVLILPDGGYPSPGDDPAAARILDRLEDWTSRGGVLIAMRGASAWLAGDGVSWIRTRLKSGFASKSAFMTDGGRPDDPQPDAPEEQPAEVIPGAILRALPESGEFSQLRLRGGVPGDGVVEPRLRV